MYEVPGHEQEHEDHGRELVSDLETAVGMAAGVAVLRWSRAWRFALSAVFF